MDDLISRQAAIDAFNAGLGELVVGGEENAKSVERYLNKVIEKIKALPPAQPEQRTGKWIPQDHNKRVGNISTLVYCYPICSKCGKVGIETYKYCPHCGAKMNQSDKTCDCYSDGRCIGTKEIDPCSCGGNKSKCDFYENVRREGDAE